MTLICTFDLAVRQQRAVLVLQVIVKAPQLFTGLSLEDRLQPRVQHLQETLQLSKAALAKVLLRLEPLSVRPVLALCCGDLFIVQHSRLASKSAVEQRHSPFLLSQHTAALMDSCTRPLRGCRAEVLGC